MRSTNTNSLFGFKIRSHCIAFEDGAAAREPSRIPFASRDERDAIEFASSSSTYSSRLASAICSATVDAPPLAGARLYWNLHRDGVSLTVPLLLFHVQVPLTSRNLLCSRDSAEARLLSPVETSPKMTEKDAEDKYGARNDASSPRIVSFSLSPLAPLALASTC